MTLKYPPPEYIISRPKTLLVQIGNSLSSPLWVFKIVGSALKPGIPPNSWRAGKTELSYLNPSSAKTSKVHRLSRVIEKDGTLKASTDCPDTSSIKHLALYVSSLNSAGVNLVANSC